MKATAHFSNFYGDLLHSFYLSAAGLCRFIVVGGGI